MYVPTPLPPSPPHTPHSHTLLRSTGNGTTFTADAARRALTVVEGWQGLSEGDVVTSVVSGGLTNVLTKVSVSPDVEVADSAPTAVLVRHFGRGTHVLINRKREGVIFAHFGSLGLSPALHGTFEGGRVEQFLEARTLTSTDLHQPATATAIGSHLARVHGTEVPNISHQNGLPDLLSGWWKLAVRAIMPSAYLARKVLQFDFADLHREMGELIEILESVNSPVMFTHMDLLAGNILELTEDDHQGEITFVDFEYGMYAWRGFDFGNHFAEAGITYDVDGFPGFYINPDDYPSDETITAFFTGYLHGQGVTDPDEIAAALPGLKQEARVFTLASHFMWGIWAIVRAATPSDDYGFLEFAAARLDQYYALRRQWGI